MTTTDNALAPVSARFALSPTFDDLPFSEDMPSGASTRPFVLRVAAKPAPRLTRTIPPSRYCPERQISVTDDDYARPIWPMGFERTTIGSKDGENPSQEDWKPDL